jgi:hypothetical protein
LRVGIFANDKKVHKAWIRVSNSSQDPFSGDDEQNTRGFAIKLFDVPGPKLIGVEENANTLDILHVAAEAFVARDNFNYSKISDGSENAIQLLLRLGIKRTKDLIKAVSVSKKEANPLRLDYFSTVPYRLGAAAGPKKAVKYRLSLCSAEDAQKFPAVEDRPEKLVRNIEDTFSKLDNVCYKFEMQWAGPKDKVEDATTKWKGEYTTVARLWIKSSDNASRVIGERKEFCEHLSLNPWRTLDVHRPLGRINRARKTTYLMSSMFRHKANKTEVKEPQLDSFEKIP